MHVASQMQALRPPTSKWREILSTIRSTVLLLNAQRLVASRWMSVVGWVWSTYSVAKLPALVFIHTHTDGWLAGWVLYAELARLGGDNLNAWLILLFWFLLLLLLCVRVCLCVC